jgi:hypothetical protein
VTPETQRIKIAQCCGWTGFNPDNIPDCLQYDARRPDGKWDELPDYLNDRNAMADALRAFDNLAPLTREQWWQRYFGMLDTVMDVPFSFMPQRTTADDIAVYMATPAQQAEAFLRTIGQYKDEGGPDHAQG